jgi:hypothetical protein
MLSLPEVLRWKPGDTLFDRFEVRVIKSGGMAIVYVCDELVAKERIVLKIPKLPLDTALDFTESIHALAKELAAWIRVGNHPNVVRLLSAKALWVVSLRGRQNGERYTEAAAAVPALFIEYGGDCNLREFLDNEPQLNSARKLGILRQVAAGMAHCERRGVSPHFDLKPQNVLVASDGTAQRIARPRGGPLDTTTLDGGLICGTPAYMAPEQWFGTDRCDARTDIYSFGILAYEVLSGDHPFRDYFRDAAALRRAHMEITPSLIPRASVDSRVISIVGRCLRKAPDERFQSWPELMKELGDPSPAKQPCEVRQPETQVHSVSLFAAMDSAVGAAVEDTLQDTPTIAFTKFLRGAMNGDYRAAYRAVWDAVRRGEPGSWKLAWKLLSGMPRSIVFAIGITARRSGCLLMLAAWAIYLIVTGSPFAVPLILLAILLGALVYWSSLVDLRPTRGKCANCETKLTSVHVPMVSNSAWPCGQIGHKAVHKCWVCRTCGCIHGLVGQQWGFRSGFVRRVDEIELLGVDCRLTRWAWQKPWPREFRFGCKVE